MLPTLDCLNKELAEMQATAVTIVSHPGLFTVIKGMLKDLDTDLARTDYGSSEGQPEL